MFRSGPRWRVTLGIVAAGFAIFRLAAHYLPIFEARNRSGPPIAPRRRPANRWRWASEVSYAPCPEWRQASAWKRRRIRWVWPLKLAMCLVLSTVAFFALFGYFNLRLHREPIRASILQSAERISEIIQRSTRHQMLRNDREALYRRSSTDIGSSPASGGCASSTRKAASASPSTASEVETHGGQARRACYACHAQARRWRRLNRPDRARIFTDAGGGRVLGIIRPVENQPDCWSAPCHAHPREKKILGVIDTQLSLATRGPADGRRSTARSFLGFTAAGGGADLPSRDVRLAGGATGPSAS